ncbi:MAG: hypothetical protein RL685_4184, partial [Pseudomonadota bacterium]
RARAHLELLTRQLSPSGPESWRAPGESLVAFPHHSGALLRNGVATAYTSASSISHARIFGPEKSLARCLAPTLCGY